MNILKQWLFLSLSLLYSFSIFSMDTPELQEKKNIIYVSTSDNQIVDVPQWQINEMKVLLVLLQHQKGSNSKENPIRATMINNQELDLLKQALNAIAGGNFEEFYEKLINEDEESRGKQIISEKGKLRILINAAQRIQASGVSAFCLARTLSSDIQKETLIPLFINPSISLLATQRGIKKDYFVSKIALSPDGTKVVTDFNIDGYLMLYDISKPGNIRYYHLKNHIDQIKKVIFSPDGQKILSCSIGDANNLVLWDISNLDAIKSDFLDGHVNEINDIMFSGNGDIIISCSEGPGPTLIKWGIKNPEEDDTLMEDHEVTAAAVSPDGKKLVCAYNDQDTLDFYDFTNKKGVKLEGYNRNSKLVMFSPDGTKIAAPSDTSRLNIWDVTNANSRYELSGNGGIVTAIAFSPDSKEIIFGSSSAWAGKQKGYNLILWDISNLKRGKSQALTGYDNGIKWVAFGDKRIAAFDDKGESLIVWDVSNFEKVIPIALMGKDIIAAALSTDGNKLVLVKMKKLILVDLVTTEEMKLLNQCDFIQAQFIYQLCISAQEKDSIALTSPYEKKIYESLHPKLQQLLQRSLDIKRNAE